MLIKFLLIFLAVKLKIKKGGKNRGKEKESKTKESGSFVKSRNVGLPSVEEENGKEGKVKKRQKQKHSGVSGFSALGQNSIGGVGFGVMPAAKKP